MFMINVDFEEYIFGRITVRWKNLTEIKSCDLDLRTQSLISKISSSFLSLRDFLISSFNENLLYEFFKRCKPAVLSAPLLIISVCVHENQAFSKSPRITENQMIMFKLKNTSQQLRAVGLFRIILTLSHFHYLSAVTVRDGNKGGTNGVKQQRKEKGIKGEGDVSATFPSHSDYVES